jgi:flagellar biosynthetic protein FliR
MRIVLDTAWIAGLLLALCRTAGFAAASPLVARVLPPVGRVLFALAGAVFLARPVPTEPTLPQLLGWAGANVAVGLVLAFVSGIALWTFQVAGEALDVNSGLAVGRVLDPLGQHEVGVLARLFQMTAFALLLGAGGDRLLLTGLARSVEALPLAGAPSMPSGVGDLVLAGVSELMLAGLELAAPALASLVLAEIALAVAARFAPQANVFLLGLPAKIALTLVLLGIALATFPGAAQDALGRALRAFGWTLRGLAGG